MEKARGYEEGFADGLKQAEKNCISVDCVNESIDKFLDKINALKKLLADANSILSNENKDKEFKEEVIANIDNVLNNEVKSGKKTRIT